MAGKTFDRIFLIVLDGVGCGEAPDSTAFGDTGSDTLGNMARELGGLKLPTLERMGLGLCGDIAGVDPSRAVAGAAGVMIERSANKDTTSGHWEMAGVIIDEPFPTYPKGFPPEILGPFEKAIGSKTLGNKVSSGTDILKELGELHVQTARPIVYTSADSVFQIAAHEEVIPLERLYEICKIARKILTGPHSVGRVIARPFVGAPGNFKRTSHRHDYSIEPPADTILDLMKSAGLDMIGLGKIQDIFAARGLTRHIPIESNSDGMRLLTALSDETFNGVAFINLVDFDMVFGHRNDVKGMAGSLEEFDRQLKDFLPRMKDRDLVLLTADHGNDPTTPSTDHSRELVPLLAWHRKLSRVVKLGRRNGFWDIGRTVADNFNIPAFGEAKSFLSDL